MKLRVVGWTYNDDDLEQGRIGWAAHNAIVDEIKKQGYLFSGWSHQEAYGCTPVCNDGKMYCFSQRGWGGVMAEAHGYTGRMDYARFAFVRDTDMEIRPEKYFDEGAFVPEFDLSERFELEVSQEVFASARHARDIRLDNLPELRYLDAGDTLTLVCGEERAEYAVADVDREKDLTEEKRMELEFAFYDFDDSAKKRRAEEEFEKAKVVIVVHVA